MTRPDESEPSRGRENETLEQTRRRLRRAWGDYPLTILVINPINLRLARALGRTSATPNQLTVLSFFLMVVSACCFVCLNRPVQALGGATLLIAYLIDCLDGDLARFKDEKSSLGAMLDPILDRFGEFAIAAGAAAGGWRASGDPLWLAAGLWLVGVSQIYFYLVDAMVWKLPKKTGHGEKAPRFTLFGTPVRFGAIEPFIWGQACFAFAGVAHWGAPVFGGMFTLGCILVLRKLFSEAGKLDSEGSEEFGVHTR